MLKSRHVVGDGVCCQVAALEKAEEPMDVTPLFIIIFIDARHEYQGLEP